MLLLSCLVNSASLTYFPLIIPSLCALLQPLAQSAATFLMWGRAPHITNGGGEAEAQICGAPQSLNAAG